MWFWVVLGGSGWLWVALGGSGWHWVDLGDFVDDTGWYWVDLEGSEGLGVTGLP